MANLLRRINPYKQMLFVGPQGSGKTQLAATILKSRGHLYDRVLIMCSQTEDNILYTMGNLPQHSNFRYIPYSTAHVEKMWTMMEEAKKAGKPMKVLLILDDILGNLNLKKSTKGFVGVDGEKKNVWELIASQARHIGLTVWFLLQTMTSTVLPAIRLNSFYHFYFPSLNTTQLSAIFEYLPGTANYRTLQEFEYDYRRLLNKPYTFIFSDRTGKFFGKNLFFCNPIIENHYGISFTEIIDRAAYRPPTFAQCIGGYSPY